MYKVIEMTKEEKMAMYMKLPKEQIIEMLINCNDFITAQIQTSVRLTCDRCGCHPNTIYTTAQGRFCQACKPFPINTTI